MTTDTIAVIVGEMRAFSETCRAASFHGTADRTDAWADRLAALGDVEKDAGRFSWMDELQPEDQTDD